MSEQHTFTRDVGGTTYMAVIAEAPGYPGCVEVMRDLVDDWEAILGRKVTGVPTMRGMVMFEIDDLTQLLIELGWSAS